MEQFNRQKLLEEFKFFLNSNEINYVKEYKLLKGNILLAYGNKVIGGKDKGKTKYSLTLKGKNGIIEQWLGENYNELIDTSYKKLKELKLVLKENAVSIISENIETSKIAEKTNGFSFDSMINSKEQSTDLKEITEKDISDFLEDGLYVKAMSNGIELTLYKKCGISNISKYSRNGIIQIIVKFVELLIEKRKKDGLEINKMIQVVYNDFSAQKLTIMEGDTGEDDENSSGYVDKNLVNSVFVLCSLSDLVINKTQLKIWLMKILKNENIKAIYF